MLKAIVLVGLLIIGIAFCAEQGPKSNPDSILKPSVYVAPNDFDLARKALTLKDFHLTRSSINTLTASFTFENPSDYDLKDAAVRCEFTAPSGTTIDRTDRTIYETFKARSKRTISGISFGFVHSQAARHSCWVGSAEVIRHNPRPEPTATSAAAPVPQPRTKPKTSP